MSEYRIVTNGKEGAVFLDSGEPIAILKNEVVAVLEESAQIVIARRTKN